MTDDGHLAQRFPDLVPGDVVAMRSSAARFLAQAVRPRDADRDGDGVLTSTARARAERTSQLCQLIYAATPFWLDQPVAWAAMASNR